MTPFEPPSYIAGHREYFRSLDNHQAQLRGVFLANEVEELRKLLYRYGIEPGKDYAVIGLWEMERLYAHRVWIENGRDNKRTAQALGITTTTLEKILAGGHTYKTT